MTPAEQHIQEVIERMVALAMYQIRKDSMRAIAELNERISWHLRSIGQVRRFENSRRVEK